MLWIAIVPPSRADVADEIARDFAPLSGYVITSADREFLIDRGAEDGVAVGDLFSVIRPGERIVHPVTGKELGTLDRVKGFLQVTRVRAGYSHARPMEIEETIKKGDPVRRFDLIPVAFVDATGGRRALYDRLRTVLPGLEWRYVAAPSYVEEGHSEGKVLAFVLVNGNLEVRGQGQVLRTYKIPSSKSPEPAGIGPAGDFAVLGDLQDGVQMADFVRDGGRLLLAATDGSRIDVYAIADRPVRLGGGKPPRPGVIHSLHWWKPRPDGDLMLAATVAVEENQPFGPTIGQTVVGAVFTFHNDRLSPLPEELPYILGSFDRDGDGIREMLLGQTFDRDIFFGDKVREFHLEDGGLANADPSFPIPRPFQVQGTAFKDLTGDGRPETVIVRGRKMFVYDGSELLYESSRQMGGSLSVMAYDLNPGAQNRQFTTAVFEVSPSVVDLNGDGRGEVVAVASEGSSAPGFGSGVRKTWLTTLEYRDGRFVRGNLGPELETPMQGLYTSRNGIFVVTTDPPSLWGKRKNASRLLFLPVQKP